MNQSDADRDSAAGTSDLSTMAMAQLAVELQKRVKSESDRATQARKVAVFAVGGAIATAIVSIIGVSVLVSRYPMEKYLYTDNTKAVCEAQLQDQPLVTTNTVLDFAKGCMLDMDTFGHDDYADRLNRMASSCLTPGFRKKFLEIDWLSDRVSTVKSGLLRVSSQTNGPVLLSESGPTPDGYRWRVQVPVKRSFRQGDSPKGSNERIYEVDVYRVVRDAYNPVGLGINGVYERSMVLK